jgi:hypothetical protein
MVPSTSAGLVTRTELAAAVRPAFAHGGAGRTELIETALAGGARPEVIALLQALPEGVEVRFLRELWRQFRDLPVA